MASEKDSDLYKGKAMHRYSRAYILLLTFLLLIGCRTPNEPSFQVSGLQLQLRDVFCTEAWLRVTTGNIPLPAHLLLWIGSNRIDSLYLSSPDTTIVVDSLLPNRNYDITGIYHPSDKPAITSEIKASTLDTTSHDFTWQTFVFPGGCKDVSIENDTSIWVAGEFTTGNAAHWNGHEWKFFRLIYYSFIGQNLTTGSLQGDAIHVFPGGMVVMCANAQITYLVNEKQIMTYWLPVSVNRIWAADTNDIYVAGALGSAAHYDGKGWTKIVTGTSMNLQDVWGIKDRVTGETIVLTVASNILTSDGNRLFKLSKTKAEPFSNNGLPPDYYFSSLWFNSTNVSYLTGGNIYRKNNFEGSEIWKEWLPRVTQNYLFGIRGNGLNDIIMAGAYGEIAHYNGITWRSYLGNETPEFYGNLVSIDIKGNTVCAVGSGVGDGNIGVITIGKRN